MRSFVFMATLSDEEAVKRAIELLKKARDFPATRNILVERIETEDPQTLREEVLELREKNKRLESETVIMRGWLTSVRDMPEYDQDDAHRLRHKGKMALEALPEADGAKLYATLNAAEAMYMQLDLQCVWLAGALNCAAWPWDPDQHRAATETLESALKSLEVFEQSAHISDEVRRMAKLRRNIHLQPVPSEKPSPLRYTKKEATLAIAAREEGEFDHPLLQRLGALSQLEIDIERIRQATER